MLLERGYLGLTMDRIAKATEYSKGTIYHHFSSKEVLLEALVDQVRSELPPQVLAVADDPDMGAVQKFVAFFERINAWKLSQAPIMVELGRAMGLPVVATHISGIPELVENERTGLLVAPGQPDELAAAIRRSIC